MTSTTDSPPHVISGTRGHRALFNLAAGALLAAMALMAGGAALRESVTVDEVAHIAAGVSYLQKLDLRLNEEHPPLPKVVAALPLVFRGARADYSHVSWTFSETFFQAYVGQWVFGEWFLTKWNSPGPTLMWARLPMLLMTLALGWVLFVYARRLGGDWGGLLCLAIYVSTPTFLAFGPLVHTDISVTLFTLLTLWSFAEIWREPTRKNVGMFAAALAGALLSKFTAGILFFAFVAFALSTGGAPCPGSHSRNPRNARGGVFVGARRFAVFSGPRLPFTCSILFFPCISRRTFSTVSGTATGSRSYFCADCLCHRGSISAACCLCW